MPSPVGHSLAAVAVGWAVARPSAGRRALARQVAVLSAIAVAPDLDLLIGRHSMETHSLGAAVLVGALAAWRRWPLGAGRWSTGLAAGLAWLSHPIADALSLDTTPPIGVMFFWPASSERVLTGWSVFAPISRRYWLPGFLEYTVMAVLRELAILLPVLAAVWLARRRRPQAPAG
jgi:inner membrane protein